MLAKQINGPLLPVLETALASHRYALALDQDNADTLFNTAQVLNSVAEEIAKDEALPDLEALRLLEEALEMQQRCLTLQEFMYTENQEQEAAAAEAARSAATDEPMPLDDESDPPSAEESGTEQREERWASIVEPVTKVTLIDTVTAQLSTLTTLCGLLSSSHASASGASLAWIEELSATLINVKLASYTEGAPVETLHEVALSEANLISALLEAGFRAGSLDAQTYKRERDAAFSHPEVDLANSPTALSADAASLIAFNAALAETTDAAEAAPHLSSMRWNALSASIANLARASKLSSTPSEDIPQTHLFRGDASLLQFQLGRRAAYPPALSNAPSLLKNAEVFYRNASKLAAHDDGDERDEALLKEILAASLQKEGHDDQSAKSAALADRRGTTWVKARVREMEEEGLLFEEDLSAVGLSL